MTFPLTHRGEIELKRAPDAAALFDRILEELRDAGLRNVQVWDGRVSFEGTKWQWGKPKNRLGSVDVGEIEISTKDGKLTVSYRFRLRGLLLLTGAFAVIGFYLFNLGDTHDSMVTSLIIAGSWLVTIIANYVQAASDFKALIRRAIRGD
jgi:hypothetical protein